MNEYVVARKSLYGDESEVYIVSAEDESDAIVACMMYIGIEIGDKELKALQEMEPWEIIKYGEERGSHWNVKEFIDEPPSTFPVEIISF